MLFCYVPFIASLSLTIRAIQYNHHVGFGGIFTLFASLFGFLIATIVTWVRYNFKKSISFYTKQGVAVILGDRNNLKLSKTETNLTAIENAIQESVNFWNTKYTKSDTIIENYLNGAIINFVNNNISFDSVDNNGAATKFVLGITTGKAMTIAWPSDGDVNLVLNVIKHEIGHVILNALNVPSYNQHKTMKDFGFPY